MRNTEPVLVTKDYIMSHRTKRGSWTKAQILALGLEYPVSSGWIYSLCGETITGEMASNFEAGKNIRAKEINKPKQPKKQKKFKNNRDAINYISSNHNKLSFGEIEDMARIIGNYKRGNK